MSVWVSVDGVDPVTYDDENVREDWFDVASSCVSDDRFRIIVSEEAGSASRYSSIELDSAGLAELQRRIIVATNRSSLRDTASECGGLSDLNEEAKVPSESYYLPEER